MVRVVSGYENSLTRGLLGESHENEKFEVPGVYVRLEKVVNVLAFHFGKRESQGVDTLIWESNSPGHALWCGWKSGHAKRASLATPCVHLAGRLAMAGQLAGVMSVSKKRPTPA